MPSGSWKWNPEVWNLKQDPQDHETFNFQKLRLILIKLCSAQPCISLVLNDFHYSDRWAQHPQKPQRRHAKFQLSTLWIRVRWRWHGAACQYCMIKISVCSFSLDKNVCDNERVKTSSHHGWSAKAQVTSETWSNLALEFHHKSKSGYLESKNPGPAEAPHAYENSMTDVGIVCWDLAISRLVCTLVSVSQSVSTGNTQWS